jgi:hypothetical protein
MTDEEILKRLNLSDADATDLTQRVVSLNPAQAKALKGVTTDVNVAAAAIGPDCAPEDLQRFLDARKGYQPSAAQIYWGPVGDAD